MIQVFGERHPPNARESSGGELLAESFLAAKAQGHEGFDGGSDCLITDLGDRAFLLFEIVLQTWRAALSAEEVDRYQQMFVRVLNSENELVQLEPIRHLSAREKILRYEQRSSAFQNSLTSMLL